MTKRWFLFFLLFTPMLSPCSTMSVEDFLQKYPHPYQDITIHGQILPMGTDNCEQRLELIKPIFELFQKPMKILDVGAAQGYFSFYIAEAYPSSTVVMIDANTNFYANHGDMLLDLCFLNDHLLNIYYLNRKMTIKDFLFLNQQEHFDLILAFLVIHQMGDTLQSQIKILESLFSLGDHVIVEVASDVAVAFSSYVEYLSKKMECTYLGEVKRHKDQKSVATGRMFWFKKNGSMGDERGTTVLPSIKKETFTYLNGVYPVQFHEGKI